MSAVQSGERRVDSPLVVDDGAMLADLLCDTFKYFERNINPKNGLVADRTAPGAPASIAALGFALSSYVVAVERGAMKRETAVARVLAAVRFLYRSEQSDAPDATGYHGLYYHFLEMGTGRRAGRCELSTIDTALLLAGVLTAAGYFRGESDDESELRALGDALYRRANWSWASRISGAMGHGWTPEGGPLPSAWDRVYSEALILYVLALGSPTFRITAKGYVAWTSTFEQTTAYGMTYVYAGALFIHQFSQLWLDLRGINDDCNRRVGYDYFENSRRATLVHREYAIENPRGFVHYSKNAWGLTASDGPGPDVRIVGGVRREFYGYLARGAPFGPDDGTISPWAVVASLPFAPEVVRDAIRHAMGRLGLRDPERRTGFDASFNPTFPEVDRNPNGWVSPWKFGLNEGPIVLMIENHLSGLVWGIMRQCPYVVRGLRRAGFRGGWLDADGGSADV